jgi:CRP-like cAMP-binding protein
MVLPPRTLYSPSASGPRASSPGPKGRSAERPPFPLCQSRVHNLLLKALPKRVFDELLPSLSVVELPRGQSLYSVGSRLGKTLFIEEGMVTLYRSTGDGRCIEITTIGHDGVIGLCGVIGHNTAATDAVVQISCNVLSMPLALFWREVKASADARRVLQNYSQYWMSKLAQH